MKMKNILYSFNIFGQITPVIKKNLTQAGCVGLYDIEEKEIFVCETIKDKQAFNKTLCHEIGHVALFRSYIWSQIPDPLHEIIVDVIATAITENAEIKWKNQK